MNPQIPRGSDELYCPFWRDRMSRRCHKCPMWQQFRGVNPNTGKEVDNWQCAAAMLPMLMIETSQQVRQAGAATESFRNEVVRRADDASRYRALPQENHQILIGEG